VVIAVFDGQSVFAQVAQFDTVDAFASLLNLGRGWKFTRDRGNGLTGTKGDGRIQVGRNGHARHHLDVDAAFFYEQVADALVVVCPSEDELVLLFRSRL